MGMYRWTGYGFKSFQVLELTRLSINRTFFLARNAFSPQKRNNIAEGNCCPILGEKTLIKQFKLEHKMKEKPRKRLIQLSFEPGGTLGNSWWGVCCPVSKNPDPISDQKMSFFTAVFRHGLQNPYPFSDRTSKKICHYLDQNSKQNDSLKSISNSFSLTGVLIWN